MKTAISEDLAYTYSWVITSSLSPRWQVTPSHASHALGAHGSPFQPILAGILSDSFSAFIAATAETNPRSLGCDWLGGLAPSQAYVMQLLHVWLPGCVPGRA